MEHFWNFNFQKFMGFQSFKNYFHSYYTVSLAMLTGNIIVPLVEFTLFIFLACLL